MTYPRPTAKRFRRRTRIQSLEAQARSLKEIAEKIASSGSRYKKIVEKVADGSSWAKDDAGVLFWLGEGDISAEAKEVLGE